MFSEQNLSDLQQPTDAEYILVIEDNTDLNLAICEILSAYGYQVKSARNGLEGFNLMEQRTPNIILCDIMMPEMDGYALLQRTRSTPQLRTVPFIFLTARSSSVDQRKARHIGIEDYLIKPIEEEDLVLAIRNALRRREHMKDEIESQQELLRNQIVGALQHEFRTPLTFVLGYAEYLQDISDEEIEVEELRTATAGILEGGYRLQKLIESFLLLAEVQNRSMKPDRTDTVRAGTVVQEAVHDLRMDAIEVGLEIEISDENEGIIIMGEQDLIIDSVKRLVDNAIRYRRPESKKVSVLIDKVENRYVGFCIQDEGLGISESTVRALLRPFEQGDRTDRTEPGAGLSLAVIHHIAHLHGGTLEVESTLGVGSTFTLWLPCADETVANLGKNH